MHLNCNTNPELLHPKYFAAKSRKRPLFICPFFPPVSIQIIYYHFFLPFLLKLMIDSFYGLFSKNPKNFLRVVYKFY